MASKASNQATAAQQMEHTRTGASVEILKAAFLDNLNYVVGRSWNSRPGSSFMRPLPNRCVTASCRAGFAKCTMESAGYS